MIEEYVPSGHQNDRFYERFMEQRTPDLNNPSITEVHDSFPFPIEPLRSIRPQTSRNDLVYILTLLELLLHLLLLAPHAITCNPYGNINHHPSSSQQAQTAQLSPREHLSPIQQFIRNSEQCHPHG